MNASVHELEDPLGNRLIVSVLTDRTAVVTIIQDDREHEGVPRQVAQVIVTPEEMQAVADATRLACGP